jgi:hypothetical protein
VAIVQPSEAADGGGRTAAPLLCTLREAGGVSGKGGEGPAQHGAVDATGCRVAIGQREEDAVKPGSTREPEGA